jgi:UDP-glucose 4-epimerase
MISWVLGRGGLLGSSVERQLACRGQIWTPQVPFLWGNELAFEEEIDRSVEQFVEFVGAKKWTILWCAGIGVVSSPTDLLKGEFSKIEYLLDRLSKCSSQFLRQGCLFYASSAGGVYAGSQHPPFTELTEPIPVGGYGQQKLRCEKLFTEFTDKFETSSVIGRIANLYGPSQNRSKGQGFITAICNAMISRKPIQIFVPLETIRNFVYVDDAASLISEIILDTSAQNLSIKLIKIVASESNVSLGQVVGETTRVFGRRPHVVLTQTEQGKHHLMDLRLESIIDAGVAPQTSTSLAIGMDRIRLHLLSELQSANLA